MPQNLTDSPTWTVQTAPMAGEPRTEESIKTPLQNAANRTKYLYDQLRLGQAIEGEGVTNLRTVWNLAALRAIGPSARAHGQIVYFAGRGIYQYRSDGGLDADHDGMQMVRPNDLTNPALGGWVWMLDDAERPFGVPLLNADARIDTSKLEARDATDSSRISARAVRNGIVHHSVSHYDSMFTETDDMSNWTGVIGATIGITDLLAGDIFSVTYECNAGNGLLSGSGIVDGGCDLRVLWFKNPGGSHTLGSLERSAPGYEHGVSVTGKGVMPMDGELVVMLQMKSHTNARLARVSNITRTVQVIRA